MGAGEREEGPDSVSDPARCERSPAAYLGLTLEGGPQRRLATSGGRRACGWLRALSRKPQQSVRRSGAPSQQKLRQQAHRHDHDRDPHHNHGGEKDERHGASNIPLLALADTRGLGEPLLPAPSKLLTPYVALWPSFLALRVFRPPRTLIFYEVG
jgi:hypothetical protein